MMLHHYYQSNLFLSANKMSGWPQQEVTIQHSSAVPSLGKLHFQLNQQQHGTQYPQVLEIVQNVRFPQQIRRYGSRQMTNVITSVLFFSPFFLKRMFITNSFNIILYRVFVILLVMFPCFPGTADIKKVSL